MKKVWTNILYLFFPVWFVLTGCKERFEPNLPTVATGYLVVEGIINSGPGETKIKLTRSMVIASQNRTVTPELRARVQVEGEDNTILPLSEESQGFYRAEQLNLERHTKYRLRIKTTSGKEYVSDFAEVKKTPAIDSINWRKENDGVQIYVNTHNPQNDTRYYKWDYEETWEYVSAVDTNYKWENGMVVERAPDEHKYRCWSQGGSTNLLLGSSAKLSQDIIYLNPLAFIPHGSIKLSHKYSILVKQYALTQEAYQFLQMMKKNTETMGSFFDPQPSELRGNIRCVTNPEEPVIGFVSVCDVVEKRIFVDKSEIGDWGYKQICDRRLVVINPDSMAWYFAAKAKRYPKFPYGGSDDPSTPPDSLYQTPHCCPAIPIEIRAEQKPGEPTNFCCVFVPVTWTPRGWESLSNICADCTVRGGNTTKPDFWP